MGGAVPDASLPTATAQRSTSPRLAKAKHRRWQARYRRGAGSRWSELTENGESSESALPMVEKVAKLLKDTLLLTTKQASDAELGPGIRG